VNSKTYVNKNKAKKNHLQKFTFAHEAITSAASEKGSHQISNPKNLIQAKPPTQRNSQNHLYLSFRWIQQIMFSTTKIAMKIPKKGAGGR
jgi:hypothetical protein